MTQTPAPRLLDRVRDVARRRRVSYRTEQSYSRWVVRFVVFHNKRHPQEMGAAEVEQFLSYLASQRQVSASTQNQAFCALLFLYRHVLQIELGSIEALRAERSRYVPTVLTPAEAELLLSHLRGTPRLVALLLYGSGLRLI
jgi:site-specific recombinase XerD